MKKIYKKFGLIKTYGVVGGLVGGKVDGWGEGGCVSGVGEGPILPGQLIWVTSTWHDDVHFNVLNAALPIVTFGKFSTLTATTFTSSFLISKQAPNGAFAIAPNV